MCQWLVKIKECHFQCETHLDWNGGSMNNSLYSSLLYIRNENVQCSYNLMMGKIRCIGTIRNSYWDVIVKIIITKSCGEKWSRPRRPHDAATSIDAWTGHWGRSPANNAMNTANGRSGFFKRNRVIVYMFLAMRFINLCFTFSKESVQS